MTLTLKAPNGKYMTRQLFWEQWIDMSNDERVLDRPPFSLFKDKPDCINVGKRYIEIGEPTGYEVSMELFGDYTLWTVLLKCRWFLAAKELWDKELDAKIKAAAFKQIKELSEDGLPAQRLAAAKYLANQEYRKDRSASKGRPSKEQVDKAAREQATLEKELADDLKRIQLVRN